MSNQFNGLRRAADPLRPAAHATGNSNFDKATEERILETAGELLKRLGRDKVSMSDVARTASVARGTLYRYFESREVLLEALSKRNADHFFEDLSRAFKAHDLLSGQLGEFSERIMLSIQPSSDVPSSNNHIAMLHMLETQSDHALLRTAKFLRPYLEAARDRGEVREDIDVVDASEWLARILLSFTVFQASVSDRTDTPRSVSLFVQRYAIDGLA
ncbi:TetR/AcrR family transcriptional regulator [Microtetraspora sp. NBRC 16547]|uniref:TetR/AcrR family transcriptional regulator n=1 Tax=Microtetraspora sp. NBRC 16547 TaxID=3030993 RepID=UPI0024A1AA95|nr:TetR/AcrR family transcriptional regulator [Microtetraspora sp. NBRC 16547]GLX02654.1 putative transcriptional regulator, TetR family protein [Microtetraspora sp. NBRC 16547]